MDLYKFFKKCFALTISIISLLFTIIPEKNFEKKVFFEKLSNETNIIVNRIFVIVVVFIISVLLNLIINKLKKKITIKDRNYCIVVEYGDIFSFVDCKKVIPFDECFTTCIGSMPSEIKPNSVCGQYLNKFPINDLQNLIEKLDLKPEKSKSKYNKKDRYASGTLIPKEDFLLLAFAKLDCNGLGRFSTYDEFLDWVDEAPQERTNQIISLMGEIAAENEGMTKSAEGKKKAKASK